MADNIRIGVVGAGYWGKNLIRNFHALGALTAFCDSDSGVRMRMLGLYPEATVYDDVDRLMGSDDIEGVVISTPAVTHGFLVQKALDAGKHVFVEKPLCLDVKQGEDLARQATACGLTLMIGHLLLYHPAFQAVSGLVASKKIGQLRYIYSNRLNLGMVRREENALWSFAPHDISMILSLTGCMPNRVLATGGHYLSKDVADTTLSHLSFANDVQAHVFVSWLHPYKDQRLVVVGENAMVVFDDVLEGPNKVLLYSHSVEFEDGLPRVSKAESEPVPYDVTEPLRLECQVFLDSISIGRRPPSDVHEGLRVLRVLNACQQSIITGAAVKIDENY
jgi:UDP-2-acetamido-3-amino-2,3-dideoxy-glucuronate N-acetyltransferase